MSFKSLFTVLTSSERAEPALEHIVALARSLDAHVDALCLGVDRTHSGYFYAGTNALILQETLTQATAEAAELAKVATDRLAASGIRWACEEGVAQLADLGRHVARRARFSDLVVLPKPYGAGCGIEAEPVVESALFDGHAPVLNVPETRCQLANLRTAVVGWNESVEAMRAVRRSLPFLKRADLVRIAIIDPAPHGPDRSDPGGPLSQMLARHGVKCEIDVLGKTMTRVSDVLNRHLTDTNADMLVMGAYGHSRFREAILGGATRNMLEHSVVPVFMAH
ncbi:MAG: universal stress protein [Pseudomonadota bacterium]